MVDRCGDTVRLVYYNIGWTNEWYQTAKYYRST